MALESSQARNVPSRGNIIHTISHRKWRRRGRISWEPPYAYQKKEVLWLFQRRAIHVRIECHLKVFKFYKICHRSRITTTHSVEEETSKVPITLCKKRREEKKGLHVVDIFWGCRILPEYPCQERQSTFGQRKSFIHIARVPPNRELNFFR